MAFFFTYVRICPDPLPSVRKIYALHWNQCVRTIQTAPCMMSDIVKDHKHSMRKNLLPLLYGPLFPISSTDMIAHAMTFGTQVLEHWLEHEIAVQ